MLLQKEGSAEPAVLSLEAVKGPCEGTTLSKAGKRLTVGRTRARDIHIKDSAVSEKHADLSWEGSRWTVTDVGSSNGTVLNGKNLHEGINALFVLHLQQPCGSRAYHSCIQAPSPNFKASMLNMLLCVASRYAQPAVDTCRHHFGFILVIALLHFRGMRAASVMSVHRRESCCAREVAELKNGDIILFGSGS